MNQNKEHWEKIYQTKRPDELSWWQDNPKISLDFIHQLNLPKSAEIIDVGGEDSKLVDCLLEEGFEHITVLDISEEALNRAKQRLGNKAKKVNWISSDITEFEITNYFDVWHDRAAFHFLTTEQQIAKYISVVGESIKHNGYLIVGTFSDNGPKCAADLM
jgi:2-polyprenyl-3-methyl-5-hydroxy-6-metoxy-1,4-benzoquinol methylase